MSNLEVRLFSNLESIQGQSGGIVCRKLSQEEAKVEKAKMVVLGDSCETICVDAGNESIVVNKELINAFLTRNPVLQEKFKGLSPENVVKSLLQEEVSQKKRPLSPEARDNIQKALGSNYSQDIVEKIITGYETEWKGFTQQLPSGLHQQTHNIQGLKIYPDLKTGELVADIAANQIGVGGFKKAKEEFRILPDGRIVQAVRYGPAEKSEQGKAKFEGDSQIELRVRDQESFNDPHILPFEQGGSYVSAHGDVKTRFHTILCDGKLTDFIKDLGSIDEKNSEIFLGNSQKVAQLEKALSVTRDMLLGLTSAHEAGIVHKDVRPDNVLYQGDRGILADFGLSQRIDEPRIVGGTPLYAFPSIGGPESFINDPKIDMFSVGVSLIELYRPDLYPKIAKLQGGIHAHSGFSRLTVSEYIDGIHMLQDKLRSGVKKLLGPEMDNLIADCLDTETSKRPTSAEAVNRIEKIIENLHQKKESLASLEKTLTSHKGWQALAKSEFHLSPAAAVINVFSFIRMNEDQINQAKEGDKLFPFFCLNTLLNSIDRRGPPQQQLAKFSALLTEMISQPTNQMVVDLGLTDAIICEKIKNDFLQFIS